MDCLDYCIGDPYYAAEMRAHERNQQSLYMNSSMGEPPHTGISTDAKCIIGTVSVLTGVTVGVTLGITVIGLYAIGVGVAAAAVIGVLGYVFARYGVRLFPANHSQAVRQVERAARAAIEERRPAEHDVKRDAAFREKDAKAAEPLQHGLRPVMAVGQPESVPFYDSPFAEEMRRSLLRAIERNDAERDARPPPASTGAETPPPCGVQ